MLKVINKNIKDLLHLFMYIAIYYLFRHLIKCNLFQEFKIGIFGKYGIQLICDILSFIYIFYFFNSLIVLRCKKILNEEKIYINILNTVISSLLIGILQIIIIKSSHLVGIALFFGASILAFFLNTPINVLIVVVSYITLLSAQILITRKMKGLKDELKAIFLSLIVTIICTLLLKINHIIIAIIIYDILYLFIGKKLEREV